LADIVVIRFFTQIISAVLWTLTLLALIMNNKRKNTCEPLYSNVKKVCFLCLPN